VVYGTLRLLFFHQRTPHKGQEAKFIATTSSPTVVKKLTHRPFAGISETGKRQCQIQSGPKRQTIRWRLKDSTAGQVVRKMMDQAVAFGAINKTPTGHHF
jgi:hypothetical protein